MSNLASSSSERRTVTVLHSLSAPDKETKFAVQLAEGAPTELVLEYFSWAKALEGEFDVFHVHWPEYLVRGRTFAGRWRQRTRLLLLLRRLRRRSIPLVRTVHNVKPHEQGSWIERALLRQIDLQTDLFVKLNPTTPTPFDEKSLVILHGDYSRRFAAHPKLKAVPGLVLNFGLIRKYKGVDQLVEAFRRGDSNDLSLRIVGKPVDEELAALVSAAATEQENISALLRFVSDEELVAEVTQAELVVLPYRELENSGVLLVALSLGRPVLVPASPAALAIREEVGTRWLHTFDAGELSVEFIRRTLANIRSLTTQNEPQLYGRDWNVIGEQHYQAYLRLLSRQETRQ